MNRAQQLKALVAKAHTFAKDANLTDNDKNLSLFVNDGGSITIQRHYNQDTSVITLSEEEAKILAGFINNAYKPIDSDESDVTINN